MAGQIALYIQDLRGGGGERNVARLARGLAERGEAVDVVVQERTGPFFSELPESARVIDLGGRRTARSIPTLSRYIASERPRALVANHTHCNVAAILANEMARPRVRLIVVERNNFKRNFAAKRGLVRLAYASAPHLYRRSNLIACVSDDMRKSLIAATGLDPRRVVTLYNPVLDDAAFTDAPRAPVADTRPLILGVGRLAPQKNFKMLIHAFARVRAVRDARLVILGEGDLRGELEREIERLGLRDDVELPGFAANAAGWMRQADVFALSSDWEGLPTVLIEAMACGPALVATDCETGPREVLEGGEHGWLTPVGDVEAFAAALNQALDRPGDAQVRKAQARKFGVGRAVDAYLRAIDGDAAI